MTGSPAVQLIEADETRISFRLIPMQLTKKKLGRWIGSSTHWRHVGSPYDCYEIVKDESNTRVKYKSCVDRYIKFRGGPDPNASWLAFNHSAGIVPVAKGALDWLKKEKARSGRQKGDLHKSLFNWLGLFNWFGPIEATGRKR